MRAQGVVLVSERLDITGWKSLPPGEKDRVNFLNNFRMVHNSGPGHHLVRTFTTTVLIVAAVLYAHNHERRVVLLWLAIREH